MNGLRSQQWHIAPRCANGARDLLQSMTEAFKGGVGASEHVYILTSEAQNNVKDY